jgi:hypothetical protein
VVVKPVDALRLQHSPTVRPGLRPWRRSATTSPGCPPMRRTRFEGTRCCAAPMQPDASLCHGQGPVLHGIREQLHILRDGVSMPPCGRCCPALANLGDGRKQHRPSGVKPGLLHGSPREGGFGHLSASEHVHACRAEWLCCTLRALLQMTKSEIAHDPAAILLPDVTDLPGGVVPPRQRPNSMWRSPAASALQLQTFACSAHSTPTDRALDWFTDV